MFCFGYVIFEKLIGHFRGDVGQAVLNSRERSGIHIFLIILLKKHSFSCTVSLLHMNFQVANFQRCKCAPVYQLWY